MKRPEILLFLLASISLVTLTHCKRDQRPEPELILRYSFDNPDAWSLTEINDTTYSEQDPALVMSEGTLHMSYSQGEGCRRGILNRQIQEDSNELTSLGKDTLQFVMKDVELDIGALGNASLHWNIGKKDIGIHFPLDDDQPYELDVRMVDLTPVAIRLNGELLENGLSYVSVEDEFFVSYACEIRADACGPDLYASVEFSTSGIEVYRRAVVE